MKEWPEEQEMALMALADGGLDSAAASRLLALVADDPDAQVRLALYRKSGAALRVYDRLAVPLAQDRQRVERARFALRSIPRVGKPQPLMLAASLLLVTGLLTLLHSRLPAGGEQSLAPTLAVALERELAGAVAAVSYFKRAATLTPLDTYVTTDGTYCRSFLISDNARDLAEGFACRQGAARWHGELVQAPAPPAHDAALPNTYAPAAAPSAIDSRLRQGALTRLSSTQTSALLDARWESTTTPAPK